MSPEQKQYIRKKRIEKILIISIQLLLVSVFFLLWEYLSNHNIINSFIYSGPSKIVKTIIKLYQEHNLFNHILCTLKEIVIAFVGGSLLGFIIAIILYEFKLLSRIIEPFLIVLNSLPKVALGPMIIIIAGANLKSVIIMTLLINLIITIINFYNGFLNIDQTKITLMKSFKANKGQILWHLIFPGSLNSIISALKVNVSMTLIGVIMGEFLVSKEGIGYLIIYGTQIFNMNLVMSGIVILIVISLLIYFIVSKVVNRYQK